MAEGNHSRNQEALRRCEKDLALYQSEIEEIKQKMQAAQTEEEKKHQQNLLEEAQRTLTSLLRTMERFRTDS